MNIKHISDDKGTHCQRCGVELGGGVFMPLIEVVQFANGWEIAKLEHDAVVDCESRAK